MYEVQNKSLSFYNSYNVENTFLLYYIPQKQKQNFLTV